MILARTISLFIRYKTGDSDEVKSRFINMHITELPISIRQAYYDNRDLDEVIKWYLGARYHDDAVEIYNISVLDALDHFILDSI